MLETLGAKLAALFGAPGGDASEPRPAPRRHAAEDASLDEIPASSPRLRVALRQIVASAPLIAAGSLHLIGLHQLQARLGGRWPEVRQRVHQLAQKLLSQHLSTQDVWFRQGEESYVVVFARLRRVEAQLLCAKIVEELQRLLLGDADAASVVVHSAVAEAEGELLFDGVSLAQLLAQVGDHPAAPAEAPPVMAPVAETRMHAAQAADGSVRSRDPFDRLACYAAEPLKPIRILYQPVWDATNQVVSIYVARPQRPRSNRTAAWGYDVLAGATDLASTLDLDLELLSQAVECHQDLYQNQFRCILSLPVHFESLAVATRRRSFVQLCRCIPQHLVPFLVFHLCHLPEGIPVSRLAEIAALLKPFSRSVIALSHLGCPDLSTFAAAGLRGVGISLPAGDPARHAHELERFAAQARKLHLPTMLEGVDTPALEEFAEKAGFGYLAGRLIGDWSEVPEHMVRRSREDLVRKAQTSR